MRLQNTVEYHCFTAQSQLSVQANGVMIDICSEMHLLRTCFNCFPFLKKKNFLVLMISARILFGKHGNKLKDLIERQDDRVVCSHLQAHLHTPRSHVKPSCQYQYFVQPGKGKEKSADRRSHLKNAFANYLLLAQIKVSTGRQERLICLTSYLTQLYTPTKNVFDRHCSRIFNPGYFFRKSNNLKIRLAILISGLYYRLCPQIHLSNLS